jgi:DNA replication initiation complex subunit (GINS family)
MMDALTFNDLRKIQKEERREEELVELDENFFLKAKEYLNRKEDDGDQRDYTSSKRVFRKIIALREKKIVKNARISLKSNIKASELNLLPREKELFRETKELFEEHRDRIEEINQKSPEEIETEGIDTEDPEPETTENEAPDKTEKEEKNEEDQGEKEEEDSEDIEDGYQKVKIVNEVPEFMGTDLESYGPFEEGDRPVIPEDNAEILVNRGNAEEA